MDNIKLKKNMSQDEDEKVFTESEAAKYIRMSRSFLSKDRMNGYRVGHMQGPDFRRFGCRAIRYLKRDLDAWIAKNRVVRELPV
jgi:hypothetical protein